MQKKFVQTILFSFYDFDLKPENCTPFYILCRVTTLICCCSLLILGLPVPILVFLCLMHIVQRIENPLVHLRLGF